MVHPQSAPFMQLKKWKKPKEFQTDDDPRGVPGGRSEADLAPDEQVSIGGPVRFVLNLDWLRRRSLLLLDDFTSGNLNLEFAR